MNKLLLLTFFGLTIVSCKQNSKKTIDEPNLFEVQSNNEVQKIDDKLTTQTSDSIYQLLVKKVESEFFNNIKTFDRENSENNFMKFKNIIGRNRINIYDLYQELAATKQSAVLSAKSNYTETRANGIERILTGYYAAIEKDIKKGKELFMKKYGFNGRLIQLFENNYCDCYDEKLAEYCIDGHCKLINGEYWRYH